MLLTLCGGKTNKKKNTVSYWLWFCFLVAQRDAKLHLVNVRKACVFNKIDLTCFERLVAEVPPQIRSSRMLRSSITCLFAPQWVWAAQQWVKVLSWKQIQHQQRAWILGSTLKRPPGSISRGLKVLKRIPCLLCFKWIKKGKEKYFFHLYGSACWYSFITVTPSVWVWAVLRVILKKVFSMTCFVVTAEALPAKRFCQLTVQRAHKQDHLAIISSQSPILPPKWMFIKKKRATVGAEQNRTGGESGKNGSTGKRRGGTGARQGGHSVSVERNSEKHP